MSVLGKGVPDAINTYPGHATHQTFCSGSEANGNVALLGFLLSWGKPDNKKGMEMYFCKDNDKG